MSNTKLTVILLGSVFLSAPVFSSASRASAGGGAARDIHAASSASISSVQREVSTEYAPCMGVGPGSAISMAALSAARVALSDYLSNLYSHPDISKALILSDAAKAMIEENGRTVGQIISERDSMIAAANQGIPWFSDEKRDVSIPELTAELEQAKAAVSSDVQRAKIRTLDSALQNAVESRKHRIQTFEITYLDRIESQRILMEQISKIHTAFRAYVELDAEKTKYTHEKNVATLLNLFGALTPEAQIWLAEKLQD